MRNRNQKREERGGATGVHGSLASINSFVVKVSDGILLPGSRQTALTYAARASSAGAKLSFAVAFKPITVASRAKVHLLHPHRSYFRPIMEAGVGLAPTASWL